MLAISAKVIDIKNINLFEFILNFLIVIPPVVKSYC